MDINNEKNERRVDEPIVLSEEDVTQFVTFMEKNAEYLDSGLGAFHTDDHSNW